MRAGPTLAARLLAAQRLGQERTRPSTPGGDVDGERRLYRSVAGRVRAIGSDAVALRTRIVDGEVARALGHHLEQMVLVGAGYDGRTLRFASPADEPVRWFELEDSATLADKAHRLEWIGVRLPPSVVEVPFDMEVDDADAVLDGAGHDRTRPSLFVCEDALRTLALDPAARLCEGLRARAAPGSALVAGFAVAPAPGTAARTLRAGADVLRAVAAGARQHRFEQGDPEKLLVVTGWRVLSRARSGPATAGRATSAVVLVAEPGPRRAVGP